MAKKENKQFGNRSAFPETYSVFRAGGQAPIITGESGSGADVFIESRGGITKREWYAGLAMQSLISLEALPQQGIAEAAFSMAESMIASSLE